MRSIGLRGRSGDWWEELSVRGWEVDRVHFGEGRLGRPRDFSIRANAEMQI